VGSMPYKKMHKFHSFFTGYKKKLLCFRKHYYAFIVQNVVRENIT